jgi:hypothetical protein
MVIDEISERVFKAWAVKRMKIPDDIAAEMKTKSDINFYAKGYADGLIYAWEYFKEVFGD